MRRTRAPTRRAGAHLSHSDRAQSAVIRKVRCDRSQMRIVCHREPSVQRHSMIFPAAAVTALNICRTTQSLAAGVIIGSMRRRAMGCCYSRWPVS